MITHLKRSEVIVTRINHYIAAVGLSTDFDCQHDGGET